MSSCVKYKKIFVEYDSASGKLVLNDSKGNRIQDLDADLIPTLKEFQSKLGEYASDSQDTSECATVAISGDMVTCLTCTNSVDVHVDGGYDLVNMCPFYKSTELSSSILRSCPHYTYKSSSDVCMSDLNIAKHKFQYYRDR
jgi:hypothetical protein